MEQKGFIGSLFDISFTEFVTTRLVRLMFILSMIIAGIVAFIFIITAFSNGFGHGLLGLIISPIVFLLIVLNARITLELIIVVFRIAENTGRMAQSASGSSSPLAPAPEPSATVEPPIA